MATYAAMPRPRLVLPIAGRAPMMLSVDGCRPESSSSRSWKPVAVPVMMSPRSNVSCSLSIASGNRSLNDIVVSVMRVSAISKTFVSASSSALVTSSGSR